MPYDSDSGLYTRRSTTVIDATPDGDTVAQAIGVKLDDAADDAVTDLNHHNANAGHYPTPAATTSAQVLRKSPSGSVTWDDGSWLTTVVGIDGSVSNIVTLDGTQTLTGKTLTNPSLTNPAMSAPQYSMDADGSVSGTWAIDYTGGPVISATAAGDITGITVSNWPASGAAGHLRLMLTAGTHSVTFPSWAWIKSDLTTTTTFADLSLTLPESTPTIIDLTTIDGGTTVYAAIVRN